MEPGALGVSGWALGMLKLVRAGQEAITGLDVKTSRALAWVGFTGSVRGGLLLS